MRKIVIIVNLILIMLLLSTSYSFAAVEIKDNASATVIKGKSISDCYDISKEMKNDGQGLEGSNVNVKMANNYEWAVVSYFSNSNYGTGGAGQNTGETVGSHLSTNGNITGVMDWGKTYTFTAGIIAGWKDDSGAITIPGASIANGTLTIENGTVAANGKSLIEDVNSSDNSIPIMVDKLSTTDSKSDYSIAKTGWWSPSKNLVLDEITYPYSFRQGLFRNFLRLGSQSVWQRSQRYIWCS